MSQDSVTLDESAFKKRGSKEHETLNKIKQSRNQMQKVKEMTDKVFTLIEERDRLKLESFIFDGLTVPITDLIDHRGYSALHLAAFKSFDDIASTLIEVARECITASEFRSWLNQKTHDDGFIALHFASFRGNLTMIELLLNAGSDIKARNNFGIDMLHVAAQGDQPLSLLYFKEKGMNIRSGDNRGSTPLHWACYSKSEIALCYLLAWLTSLEDQDVDGFTPLHLAVKSVESLKSTRPVRALLIRGASREARDK